MRLLHAGCGNARLPTYLPQEAEEVRLDADPEVLPHIVANITEMGEIGQFEGVFSSHVLEHLYPHQVSTALGEFFRVLKPRGWLLLFVPDLENVKATEDVLFESQVGPITGLDLIYGHRRELQESLYMAHHNGFTQETLGLAVKRAGFVDVTTHRMSEYNLLACGRKP